MQKPEAESVTLDNVLDYVEAAQWIDHVLGFDQRSAHERFPEQGDHLDYWHYALSEFLDGSNFNNDSYVRYGPYSFESFAERTEEKYGPDDWRTFIAKVWAKEYPDPQTDERQEPGYTIWMSW